jgi:hypothetical protein
MHNQKHLEFLEFSMPSRQTLTSLIEKRYVSSKQQLINELKLVDSISLTSHGRTSNYSQKGFQTTTAHFIDEKGELIARVLETNDFGLNSHTGQEISKIITKTLDNFKIFNKSEFFNQNIYSFHKITFVLFILVKTLTTDNCSTQLKANRLINVVDTIPSIGCSAHLIQLAIKKFPIELNKKLQLGG